VENAEEFRGEFRCGSGVAVCRKNKSAVLQLLNCAPVAQLDRASGYEPEGREFESPRAHHIFFNANNFLLLGFFLCVLMFHLEPDSH
jgi:hypothetical protein